MEKRSDRILVEKVLGGSGQAFEELVRKYEGRVFALALHYLGNREEAEDRTQEAFLLVYRSLPNLDDADKFGAWLRGLVTRVCLNWLKKQKRRSVSLTEMEHGVRGRPLMVSRDTLAGDTAAIGSEVKEAVRRAIRELPRRDQLPVLLRYVGELSYHEIADFTDMPVSTVRGILYRANKILRQELRDIRGGGSDNWLHANK
ncbi:RNA polymerase sigma factor [Candidatus Hydrogenedentota bacterium]